MARLATGKEAMDKARAQLFSAKTVDQLQVAQALLFPLDFGLSLHQTAQAIGKTAGWVSRARLRYIKGLSVKKPAKKHGGRRNNLLSRDDERTWVERVRKGKAPWQSDATLLQQVLEKVLQRRVALSTIYRIIHRVDEATALKVRSLNLFDHRN